MNTRVKHVRDPCSCRRPRHGRPTKRSMHMWSAKPQPSSAHGAPPRPRQQCPRTSVRASNGYTAIPPPLETRGHGSRHHRGDLDCREAPHRLPRLSRLPRPGCSRGRRAVARRVGLGVGSGRPSPPHASSPPCGEAPRRRGRGLWRRRLWNVALRRGSRRTGRSATPPLSSPLWGSGCLFKFRFLHSSVIKRHSEE